MSISKDQENNAVSPSQASSSQPSSPQGSGSAPHQASQQQVEQVIASALPLTGVIPVVEATASPNAQGSQQPHESGFAEAIRVAGVIMLGLFFVGIGLGVGAQLRSAVLGGSPAAGAGVCRFGRVRADRYGLESCLAILYCGDDSAH